MRLLTWLGGPMIDITPDPDTAAMLDQPAACDKHRELVDAAAIEAAQERIVAKGGTVRNVGMYYTPEPIVAAIGSGGFLATSLR